MVLFYLFILKTVHKIFTSELKYKIIIASLEVSKSQFSFLIYNFLYSLSLIKKNRNPVLITPYINNSPSKNSSDFNIAAGTFKNSRHNSKNILLVSAYPIFITEFFSAPHFNRMNIF